MADLLEQLKNAKIDWQKSADSPYIFQTSVNQKVVRLRLNDFPEEPLCTVIIDGQETDVHEFPQSWTLPRHRGEPL
jgi:hypothetical protein